MVVVGGALTGEFTGIPGIGSKLEKQYFRCAKQYYGYSFAQSLLITSVMETQSKTVS